MYRYMVMKGDSPVAQTTTLAEAQAEARKCGGRVCRLAAVSRSSAAKPAAKPRKNPKPAAGKPERTRKSPPSLRVGQWAWGPWGTGVVRSVKDGVHEVSFLDGKTTYSADSRELTGPFSSFDEAKEWVMIHGGPDAALLGVRVKPTTKRNPPLAKQDASTLLRAIPVGGSATVHAVKVSRPEPQVYVISGQRMILPQAIAAVAAGTAGSAGDGAKPAAKRNPKAKATKPSAKPKTTRKAK